MNKIALYSLRVNNKSLAAEARIIRQEIMAATEHKVINSLHHHKMTRLKPEARLGNLSIAYLKGRDYRQVENHARTMPNAHELCRKLQRFVPEVTKDEIVEWLNN